MRGLGVVHHVRGGDLADDADGGQRLDRTRPRELLGELPEADGPLLGQAAHELRRRARQQCAHPGRVTEHDDLGAERRQLRRQAEPLQAGDGGVAAQQGHIRVRMRAYEPQGEWLGDVGQVAEEPVHDRHESPLREGTAELVELPGGGDVTIGEDVTLVADDEAGARVQDLDRLPLLVERQDRCLVGARPA